MIWDVDAVWLLMAFGAVAALSFMLSLLLESNIGREGFGPFGNSAMITAGFFIAIAAANHQGYSFGELKYALIVGLCGSFALMFVTLLVKGIWARL